jgi:flagellar protein FlaG
MFEAVNNITSKAPAQGNGNGSFSSQVVPLRPPEQVSSQNIPEKMLPQKGPTAQAQATQEAEKESNEQVTEEMLVELERDIQSIHSIGLKFSKHDESGRTMIKVMDKQNEELIREIPSEEVLNLAAKIDEMIGILFDKKV